MITRLVRCLCGYLGHATIARIDHVVHQGFPHYGSGESFSFLEYRLVLGVPMRCGGPVDRGLLCFLCSKPAQDVIFTPSEATKSQFVVGHQGE